MQKITPFLWFEKEAEDAAIFYTSIFKDSKIISSSPMMVRFIIEKQEIMALNGGPMFKFNESVSLYVDCKDQKEVDYYWESLSNGGSKGKCGWLKDRYGLSWQVIPSILGELMQDEDRQKADRVMAAMLKMTKIDIEGLKLAYDEKD